MFYRIIKELVKRKILKFNGIIEERDRRQVRNKNIFDKIICNKIYIIKKRNYFNENVIYILILFQLRFLLYNKISLNIFLFIVVFILSLKILDRQMYIDILNYNICFMQIYYMYNILYVLIYIFIIFNILVVKRI